MGKKSYPHRPWISWDDKEREIETWSKFYEKVLTELKPEVPRPVMASSGSTSSFAIANRESNILKYQKLFQGGDHGIPVYLRGGSRDKLMYNTAMVLSVCGIGITLGTIYVMASGNLKKA